MPPNAAEVLRCVPRLTHGELIILEAVQSSTAYAVRPADQDDGGPALLYLSSIPPHGAVEPAACLEVVEQGEWLGLRSPMLEGLFLQARKKTPNLVFFSPRLGVWEQWKAEAVYQGMLQQQSPAICLTSRQVPTITISVRAWRVGCTLPPPPPPRHLPALPPPLQPPQPPPQQLDTVTGHATDQQLPGAASSAPPLEHAASVSSSLQDDALELSHHVVRGYVLKVTKWPLYLAFRLWRAQARRTRRRREEAAAHSERRLQSAAWAAMQQQAAGERHARHMIMLACQCWARHHTRRLAGALQRWHARARRSALLGRVQELCQQRRRRRCSTAVLAAWSRCAQERRVLRLRGEAAGAQMARRRALRIVQGWRETAAAQRHALSAFGLRRQRTLLAAALAHWHSLSRHLAAARSIADASFAAAVMAARSAVLQAWMALCEQRRQLSARGAILAEAAARRRIGAVWCAWRALVELTAARHRRVELLILIRKQQLAGRVLRRWLVAGRVAATLRVAAEHMAERREQRRLPAAFAAWRAAAGFGDGRHVGDCVGGGAAAAAARLAGALERCVGASRRAALARRVLAAWGRLAARNLQLQSTAAAVARMRRRAAVAAALASWHGCTQAWAAARRRLVAEHCAARLRKVVRAWARAALYDRGLRAAAALASRRLRRRRLACLFCAWRGVVELRREQWGAAMLTHSRALALRTLEGWRRRCAAVRSGIAELSRCRQAYERQLLRGALRALAARGARARAERACCRQRAAATARRALRGWRHWASRSASLAGFSRLLGTRWRRCIARGVLRAWFVASHVAALQVQLLDAMQAASWGGGGSRRAAPGAFPQVLLPQLHAPAGAAPPGGGSGDGAQESVLRLLMVPFGGASTAGGRGGAAATAAMAELLRARLPALARLAALPRRHACTAFRAWRLAAARRARLRAASARLGVRRRQLLLSWCYQGWTAAAAEGRARRGAVMAMARRLVRSLVAACLAAWWQLARRSARLRRTCVILLARRTERMRRAVLMAWRVEVVELRSRLAGKQRDKRDARLSLLDRAVRSWRLGLAEAAEAREAAEKRYAAVWTRVKRQVLSGWQHATVMSLQHLTTCTRLLRTRAERRLLAGVMQAWSAFASAERQRREEWPVLCRVFYAWRTLVQPAGRAAAAAAAAAAELEAERHHHAAATVGPPYAAATLPPLPPRAGSVAGRADTESGLSSPAASVRTSHAYSLGEVEELRGQAGALATQNMAWQQWYNRMMQTGGLAGLSGGGAGPILLPMPPSMMVAAEVGRESGEALRERLERLEVAVRRELGEGGREGAAPPSTSTAASARAVSASCRPEPGPQSQVRQTTGGGAAAAVGRASGAPFPNEAQDSPTGAAAATTQPLPALAAAASSATTVPAPAPAASVPGEGAGAVGAAVPQQLPAAAPAAVLAPPEAPQHLQPQLQQQQQSSSSSSSPTSMPPPRGPSYRMFSASVPPEPGPLYQIRQGGTTTVGRASNRSLSSLEAPDSTPSSNGGAAPAAAASVHGPQSPTAPESAPQPTDADVAAAAMASSQGTATSAPAVAPSYQQPTQLGSQQQQQQPQQEPQQQEPQQQQPQQEQEPQQPMLQHSPGSSSSSRVLEPSARPEPGPLFQMREGGVTTVGRASSGFLDALAPEPAADPAAAAAAAQAQPDPAGGIAQLSAAHPPPPPAPPLPPPGLARSSSPLVQTASCAPEPGLLAQIRQHSGGGSSSTSSNLGGRGSSGAISAVEPAEWAAATAAAAAPPPPAHTLQVVLQPHPRRRSSSRSRRRSPSSRAVSAHAASPRASSGSADSAAGSSPSSEDTASLASPGSLQDWSRRTTADLTEAVAEAEGEPEAGAGGSRAAGGVELALRRSAAELTLLGAAGGGGGGGVCKQGAAEARWRGGSARPPFPGNGGAVAPAHGAVEAEGRAPRRGPLPLSPIPSPSDRSEWLDGGSSGGSGVVYLGAGADVGRRLQQQALLELGQPQKRQRPGSPPRGPQLTPAAAQGPSPPYPLEPGGGGAAATTSFGGMRVVDVVAAEADEAARRPAGPTGPGLGAGAMVPCMPPASLARMSDASLDVSGLPAAPAHQPAAHGGTAAHQPGSGCDPATAGLTFLPPPPPPTGIAGQYAAPAAFPCQSQEPQSQPQSQPQFHLQLQSPPWVPVAGGVGVPGAVFTAAPAAQSAAWVLSGAQPATQPLGAQPQLFQAQPLQLQLPPPQQQQQHPAGAPQPLLPAAFAASQQHHHHHHQPVIDGRLFLSSQSPPTLPPQPPPPYPPPPLQAPPHHHHPNMAEVEALLGELEARSRSAMSSPRRPGYAAAAGAVAGGAYGPAAAAWRAAKADTSGGAAAAAAAGSSLGLQGLDGIDALLLRASTLSAPGAPIFTPRAGVGGSAVAAAAPAAASDASSDGGSEPLRAAAASGPATSSQHAEELAAAAAGVLPGRSDAGGAGSSSAPPSEDGAAAAAATVDAVQVRDAVHPVDAALRRLEVASAKARDAAAAWSAAVGEAEAADAAGPHGDQESIARTAAAPTPAPALDHHRGGPRAVGAGLQPSAAARQLLSATAAAAAAVAGGRGAAPQPSIGGSSGSSGGSNSAVAALLATFLPSAEELIRRQGPASAGYAPPPPPPQQQQQQQQQLRLHLVGLESSGGDGDVERDSLSGDAGDESDASATAARAALRQALRSQPARAALAPGLLPVQRQPHQQPQPARGPLQSTGPGRRPIVPGFGLSSSASEVEAEEAEAEGICPACGSPTRTQRRPSSPPTRYSPEAAQKPRSPGEPNRRYVQWGEGDAAAAGGGGGAPVRAPPPERSTDAGATLRRQLPPHLLPPKLHLPPHPPHQQQQLLPRPYVDPLEEVAELARRRGNMQLAATLATLTRDNINGARGSAAGGPGLPAAEERPLLLPGQGDVGSPRWEQHHHYHHHYHHQQQPQRQERQQPYPLQQQHSSSSWGGAGGGSLAPPLLLPMQSWPHGDVSMAGLNSAALAAVAQTLQQQQQPLRQAELDLGGAQLSRVGSPPRHAPRSAAFADALERARLTSSQPPPPVSLPQPVPSADSRVSNTGENNMCRGAGGDSSSGSDGTSAASVSDGGGGGGSSGGSVCEAVAGGFDPDPLHSPLRGVLGECRRLQSCAALREAEGDALVRDVVAELSPRSAVAAALQAIISGQTQSGSGGGGGGGPGAGPGRRLLAPAGRRV
ncbi:hypothetical protein PLESTB_001350200 [Pleodorina starrii]|uniref:Sfi1 spindle body domain-containing protein n=1 Tax=Pleodorina starrii TaxID=330485 RepID=A0A9W6BV45_9CHLO|nr:hypothetical protein PLESTB_001350200 [Pleodorina starrii]